MLADINGDGKIDYEEFMKYFSDIHRMIGLHSGLQKMYSEERNQQKVVQ